MAQKNRWHPCMLSDDYLRKLKQDLAEADAAADSTTRLEPEAVDATPADAGQLEQPR
jgi:hypothetical protein